MLMIVDNFEFDFGITKFLKEYNLNNFWRWDDYKTYRIFIGKNDPNDCF